ncbi:MAG TPA: hypothetical protein VI136_08755 [Verrucomicrobiae bacterium]
MNADNTPNPPARPPHAARTIHSRRGDLEPVPAARPMVVTLILSAGALALIAAVVFALATRSQNSRPPASALVAQAGEEEVAENDETLASPPISRLQSTAGGVASPSAPRSVEEQWGIQITSMRVGFGGNGLDLRYKVTDPTKATNLLHLREITYVIDQETGKALPLPFQKENQTSQKLVAGKTYFALLANKGQVVKPGSKVTVAIGNSRVKDVPVE